MHATPVFHTHTALAMGLCELFRQLAERLALRSPLSVYLAGGMAVHLYTASRVTTDVDAEFGGRIYLPNDLVVEVTLEDGSQQLIYLDTNLGLFTLFFRDALRVKKAMRKARNAAGVGPRQGFATPRMAFLAATRRERGENSATRCCTPRPDAQSGRRRAPRLALFSPRSHSEKQCEQALTRNCP